MAQINKYTVEYGCTRKAEIFATENEMAKMIKIKPHITTVYKGKDCELIFEREGN